MSRARDAAKLAKERQDQAIASLFGRFEVASVSPDEVFLDGDDDESIPAVFIAGLTYTVGDTGMYVLPPGQQPICFISA